MSSHILQEIQATVDRIIIINEGQIIADGTSEDLINKGNNNTIAKRRRSLIIIIFFLEYLSTIAPAKIPKINVGKYELIVTNAVVVDEFVISNISQGRAII